MIFYTDKKLSGFQRLYQSKLSDDGFATVKSEIDRLRSSDKELDKLKSAVGYAELAVYQINEKKYFEATYNLHFAAHTFRICGNTNKAARLYEKSFDTGVIEVQNLQSQENSIKGTIKLQKFNQRSIGRSAKLFTESGCPREAIQAYHKREDGRALLASLQKNKPSKFGFWIWKFALGYNLSLIHLAWVILMICVGLIILPIKPAVALTALGLVAILASLFRLLSV